MQTAFGFGLDPKYTEQIVARQVAIQAKLRADEETKTAFAQADKARADAQANYEKVIVEAKRDKEQGILQAEKEKQQKILASEASARQVELAAEAEKNQNVLRAEGDKTSGELRAVAIIALGRAEAEAKKLQLSAYAVPGADAFVKIEVSKQLANAYGNIKGYLPEKMNVTLLTEQFDKGVNVLVGGTPAPSEYQTIPSAGFSISSK